MSAEIPGITLVLKTHVGLFVKNRLWVFRCKVGSVTTWVRPLSVMTFMNVLVSCGWLYLLFLQFLVVSEVEVPNYPDVVGVVANFWWDFSNCWPCLLDGSVMLCRLILFPQCQIVLNLFHSLSLFILGGLHLCHVWLEQRHPLPDVFVPWESLSVFSYCGHPVIPWENSAIIDIIC